ncbi:FUSC family protein [Leucobacter sp. UCMA 4100]|uniref:FUSC family protein n=1 Tax=Leucobacter sp. UCMA 4100 TaxID=2810534 RepID=UPI0022EB5846|nr:FUSC family protein [Leucobacter sp. UCMA 4100]MDA3146875.1 FUSC family protein [Leucobacter sp. UCMA 4100]
MHNARSELKSALRSLFTLNPQKGPRRWIATRAALSMGVPLAVMTFAGRPDLGLQAGTGAFLALFFAGAQAKERAKVLPVMAAALLACAAIGTWLAPWPWISATVMVFVAIAGSAFAFGFRIGPPGPVFFVLMYGLASMITAEYDGARRIDPLVFLTALASGLAFAYLLALLPLLLPSQRTRPARTLRELLPGPWLGDGEGWLIARVAVVSAAGMVVSMLWIDPGRAYWTVAAGIAVIGLSTVPTHALSRGMHRTFGTLVGALLYLVIAPLGAHPWAFVLLLAGLQFVIELVVVRNYGVALVFITPLVLLIAGAAMGSTDHLTTATERLVDTAVGSALAMASGFLQRPGAASRASR